MDADGDEPRMNGYRRCESGDYNSAGYVEKKSLVRVFNEST